MTVDQVRGQYSNYLRLNVLADNKVDSVGVVSERHR